MKVIDILVERHYYLGSFGTSKTHEWRGVNPAFNELNLADWLIHSESQGKPQAVHEPILITNQGILLAGSQRGTPQFVRGRERLFA